MSLQAYELASTDPWSNCRWLVSHNIGNSVAEKRKLAVGSGIRVQASRCGI